ncbi:MAG: hypothetical protein IAE90_11175 [Ignavibacteria bacterium]|nr:hypothetical protein [Ignavibacteria bacterium]
MKAKTVILLALMFLSGCGLFGKKNFEDTDTYKELMKQQEENDKMLDSIRRQNYRQLNDSARKYGSEMDSIKRSTDSLKKVLENSIQNLKNKK